MRGEARAVRTWEAKHQRKGNVLVASPSSDPREILTPPLASCMT